MKLVLALQPRLLEKGVRIQSQIQRPRSEDQVRELQVLVWLGLPPATLRMAIRDRCLAGELGLGRTAELRV